MTPEQTTEHQLDLAEFNAAARYNLCIVVAIVVSIVGVAFFAHTGDGAWTLLLMFALASKSKKKKAEVGT